MLLKSVIISLMCLFVPVMAEAGALASIEDFSPLPMGKQYTIEHADGSVEKLEYAETRIHSGDQLFFPKGASAKSWVKIRLNDKKGTALTLKPSDSPWSPSGSSSASMLDESAIKLSSLYASVFQGEKRARYTQGMSRGHASVEAMSFPLNVSHRLFLIPADISDFSVFWNGGKAPFTLSCERVVGLHALSPDKERIYGHTVYQAVIPIDQRSCTDHAVQYSLRDSDGHSIEFSVVCSEQVSSFPSSLDSALLHLDDGRWQGETVVSQRLLLWNRVKELPVNSSKRASIQWMLLTGAKP